VTANRDRRASARARLERDMAIRAEAAKRRRRTQTIVAGTVAGVVLVGAIVFITIVATGDDGKKGGPNAAASPSASAEDTSCVYRPLIDPSASSSGPPASLPAGVKDVGKPDAANIPRTGKEIMTMTTSLGVIKIEMDLTKVPCTAANFAFLAGKKFFDNTKCHRLVPSIGALQCGDPSGDGTGGPAYRYKDENLPVKNRPAYPEGAVAMANAGADTNGSQFFFVYKDSELQPQYTLLGRVTEGLDIIKKVAAAGDDGAFEPDPGGGHPKTELLFQTVTVTPAAA
jgi:peptidyl-prolyl cis-trans isomerase B (cyclophilin B)